MKILAIALSALFLLSGCATGNCRSQKEDQMKKNPPSESLSPISSETIDRVRVYKYDGSLQCGMGKAVPLAEMQKELKSIKVYSSANKPDGLMHIQQCGTPTGTANVYEIEKKDLESAKKLGFKLWTFG